MGTKQTKTITFKIFYRNLLSKIYICQITHFLTTKLQPGNYFVIFSNLTHSHTQMTLSSASCKSFFITPLASNNRLFSFHFLISTNCPVPKPMSHILLLIVYIYRCLTNDSQVQLHKKNDIYFYSMGSMGSFFAAFVWVYSYNYFQLTGRLGSRLGKLEHLFLSLSLCLISFILGFFITW